MTSSPVKDSPIKKGRKGKEIKREIKQEIKLEPPCTPTQASKRPRSISGELSIRKRPGAVTRIKQKALDALGPLEDSEELEPLEKLLEGEDGEDGEDGAGEVVGS